jgi:hypothetical protein
MMNSWICTFEWLGLYNLIVPGFFSKLNPFMQLKRQFKQQKIEILSKFRSLIGLPAVFADFSAGASEGTDITHIHHGSCEVRKESVLIGTVGSNLRICRTSIKQLLVGVEKSLLASQITVILVVECGRGSHI